MKKIYIQNANDQVAKLVVEWIEWSATEAVDLGSIPGRVKPKTIKIGIHSFPAWRSAIKGTVWSLRRVW